MKKILVLIICMFLLSLTACGGNSYESHENSILFILNDEYKQYMPYDTIPSFTLEFDGIINIGDIRKNKNEVIYIKNDDFKVSQILSDLLQANAGYVGVDLLSEELQKTTRMNKLDYNISPLKQEVINLVVDDEKVYNENYFITLENGLQLSFECRRFNSTIDGVSKTYYAWRYTYSIRMYLHYTFYANKNNNGDIELLLLTLPNNIKYHVGTSTSANNLTSKDTFLDESYYYFNYLNYQSLVEIKESKTLSDTEKEQQFNKLHEEEVKYVKDYYIDRWNGRMEDSIFKFDYLGRTFNIEFNEFMFNIKLD